MNVKDKKNENIEIDDMNIKSHLNNSLDLSKISVSEDLINRTLKAIRQQPFADDSEKNENFNSKDTQKNVIPWNRYIRRFAGVAAAALIIFVGFNVIKSMPDINMGSKKDSATEDGSYSDSVAEEAPQDIMEFSATSQEESADMATTESEASTDIAEPAATQFTIQGSGTADDAQQNTFGAVASDTDVVITEVPAGALDNAKIGMTATKDSGESQELTFQNICILTPEQLESITITSKATGVSISLTDQIEILDFYTMMEKHTFTYTAEGSANQSYTVDLITPKPGEAVYTIWVGENVTVRYANGGEVSDSTYNPLDYDTFIVDLGKFFEEYSR